MQKKSRNYQNKVFIKQKIYNQLILCILISFILLLLSCFFCHLDETVTTEGQIRPLIQEASIKTQFSGNISQIMYKNTDFVNKGDLLFIQDTSYENEYLIRLKKLVEYYENNIYSYKQLENLLTSTSIEEFNYDDTILTTNGIYSSFVNQYKKLKNELSSKKDYYILQSQLYPNLISKQEIENIKNDYIQFKFTFLHWIDNQRIEVLENLSTYTQKLEECKLNIIQINNIIEKATIKANISGFIHEINKISIGDYLTSGTEILTIIPQNPNLKVIININNSNISKIKLGQEVFIQIKDLPYTKYGKLKGIISFIPNDVAQGTTYFPVEVYLEKNFLQSKNKFTKNNKIFLKIGTKVSAKIIVDKNTLFQKFLQKVIMNDD